VLVGELLEHLADDRVDVALVVAEIVGEGPQRGPGDLQLGRGEIEPVGDLVGSDQVELFVRDGGGRLPFPHAENVGPDRLARELPGDP
jgi:hypothetical protein